MPLAADGDDREAETDGFHAMPRRAVGARRLRVEDRWLLIGDAEFVDDLELDGMLHARFARSPLAHARVRAVDVRAAADAPGVRGAFAAADARLPPLRAPIENPLAFSPARAVLADRVVRFVGEPMAVVVADSPYHAEDGAELVDLDLEPLPVVSDPLGATADDAPRLHAPSPNVLYDAAIEAGEVDAAFERAAAVVRRSFVNPRYSAAPMEPRALVAVPRGGGLTLFASTQAPHKLRVVVAEALALDPELVRVAVPDVGGGFGQKAHVYPEDVVVAWAALRLDRPVKWVEDRVENLLASSHARDQRLDVRAACDAEGRLLAIEADVVCDVGAYGVYPHGHILEALGTPAMIPGPYRLPAYRARSRAVATNKCPEGAYRGVGLPVSAFVHERLLDLLATEVGIGRDEIRRRNLVGPEDMPHTTLTNQRYDSGDYPAALERALEAIGYDDFPAEQERARAEGRLLGLGLSCWVEYTGINSRVFSGRGMVGIAGYDGAHVELGGDGGATLHSTLPAIGQGTETTFAQVIADALGLDADRVRVARSDTAVGSLHGTGTFASRSAVSGGGALVKATATLRERLLEDAADRLEAAAADLRLEDGFIHVAGSPASRVSVAEVVAAAPPGRFAAAAHFDPPALAYPYATHACIVEVDRDTGGVRILRYVVVEDCGTIINPLIVDGQVHGAVAQGIGGTLYESLAYDADGQLVTASFMDYLVPVATDLPALELTHMETPAPESPTGAKGVGEGGTLGPPGAIANAVCDALGADINELPLTPERVRAAMR
jgi:carbon-monoxide dehydrogenase large subunit